MKPKLTFSDVNVEISTTRYYCVDWDRIRKDFATEIAKDTEEFGHDEDEVLQATFWELCGTWADQDHVDGQYVRLVDETTDVDKWGLDPEKPWR